VVAKEEETTVVRAEEREVSRARWSRSGPRERKSGWRRERREKS
jgi:hypothetical protein